jgi:DNA-directed RNA polymerase subunit RPC12/RpoP
MDTFNDKSLNCADCGQEFIFSRNEQAFYAERGFTNEPKRCKNCRDKRKTWPATATAAKAARARW